jgi:regulator of sirC expression with transglutaminase-like and TPR domain
VRRGYTERVDFREYAAQSDDRLDLLTGALLIAEDAHPGLDLAEQARRVDELAAPLTGRGLDALPAVAQAQVLADHLFVRAGFHGNTEDYYDPRNSLLNEVLDRRTGIPITLSILYIEVSRRLGVQARGVGFPGHFLVRLDDEEGTVIVDPFSGGQSLSERALENLLGRGGARIKLDRAMLDPTPVRHIVARVLMNLRGIYAARGDWARLLVVLDRLIDLVPEVTDELRERGLLLARLGAPKAALDDLRRYVSALPHAGDAGELQALIARLENGVDARLN